MPPTAPPLRPRRRGAPLLGLMLALASAVLCLQPPAAAAFAAPPPAPAPAEGACWEQPKLRSLGPCVEADGPELNVTLQVGPRGGCWVFFGLAHPLPSSRTDTLARAPVTGGRGALRAATVADGHRHPA